MTTEVCECVWCAVYGVRHAALKIHVVYGSMRSSVWQRARQCAAVRQCDSVRQCARLCVAVHVAVCGSALDSVQQCGSACVAVQQCAAVRQ